MKKYTSFNFRLTWKKSNIKEEVLHATDILILLHPENSDTTRKTVKLALYLLTRQVLGVSVKICLIHPLIKTLMSYR